MTYQELAQQSLDVQDACNLSGVVHAFSRAMGVLWVEADRINEGTDWVNSHPIVCLFLDKLNSLNQSAMYQTGCACNSSQIFAAYDAVHKIAGDRK